MTQFPPPKTPTRTFPYRIDAQIGEGAMGLVFRAEEPLLKRRVAIKALRPHLLESQQPKVAEEARKRFLQEARAAAALAHPGVATIYGIGEEDGVPYIAMEWLDGLTLEEILEKRGPLDIPRACRVIVDLLEALDLAHRSGVIHRDIKPSNLMIVGEGRLKVTDFGIAHVQGSDLVQTQAGLVLATPKFASPEQLRAEDIDGRSDLFASGVLLFHVLTGHYPFDGKSFMEVANAILREPARPLEDHLPDVPAALQAVLHRALKKDRKERYENAREMADALRPLCDASTGPGQTLRLETLPPAGGGTVTTDQTDLTKTTPMVLNLPGDRGAMVLEIVKNWPERRLDRQSTDQLLQRLQEQPLNAPYYAGAAFVDSVCLLVEGGLIIGAVDTTDPSLTGNAATARLSQISEPVLHPLPDSIPTGVMQNLASLLSPGPARHADLDSSYTHLPALADKLANESFSGQMRLRRGEGCGYLLFDRGRIVLTLYAGDWSDVALDQPWQEWVSDVAVRAWVEERHTQPLLISLRQRLEDVELEVEPVSLSGNTDLGATASTTSKVLALLKQTGGIQRVLSFRITPHLGEGLTAAMRSGLLPTDPVYRFLDYLLKELPSYFHERDKDRSWKYLVAWIFLVRRALLHHTLPHPTDDARSDSFDLVTFDEKGKVLHVADYCGYLDPQGLQDFCDKVVRAKTARVKTGDIGGALLIAPDFSPEVLQAYKEITAKQEGGWFFEETFTGYEGFVRMSSRRGFHLLLLQDDGETLKPVLPPS
ncbi:MAG: serine/threonine-protein kinase [Acidobacteriota bacterium]